MSSSLRSLLFVLPFTVAPLPAAAADEGETPVPRTLFQEEAEVRVINVDVMVSDADGRPVTGLGAEHFRLTENGERVELSNFYAVEGAEGEPAGALATDTTVAAGEAAVTASEEATAERPMLTIVYVDSTALHPRHRARTLARLREVVQGLPAESQVMVAGDEGEPVIYEAPTQVRSAALAALERLAPRLAPRGADSDAELRDLLRQIGDLNVEQASGVFQTKESSAQADFAEELGIDVQAALLSEVQREAEALLPELLAHAVQRRFEVESTLRSLRAFLELAAGLPGRKALLYVGDRLTSRPGEPVYDAFRDRLDPVRQIATSVALPPPVDLSGLFTEIATFAASARIAFYTMDPGNAGTLERGSAATRAGSGGNFSTWGDRLERDFERDREEVLWRLAEETGGRFSRDAAQDAALLRGLHDDFTDYYSLGYRVDPTPGEEPVRRIEVEVDNPAWRVRYRRRFQDRGAAGRTADRTRAALVVPVEPEGFDIAVEADAGTLQEDGTFAVPIRVLVPLGQLVLLPGPTEHQARVSVFVAARDERGRMSDVKRNLCPVHIPNQELLTAMGRSAACGVHLKMRRGRQRLAVSVLDELAAVHATATLDLDVGAEQARSTAETR